MKQTVASVLPREILSSSEEAQMYQLLRQHFENVTQPQFERDLSEKNWVILLHQESRLVGFSTLLSYKTLFEGERIGVVYSGDTIVAPEAWGSTALARSWIETVRELRDSSACDSFYWLLLTSGFRTYRFLSVFWKEFWPRFDASMPAWEKSLKTHLAVERFTNQYDPTTGLVRFNQPQKLRRNFADVPLGRIRDPHIAFFLARNPNHAAGDELVCLTELADSNLTRAGRRMISTNRHEAELCAR
jgi:hypothetical protein